MSEQVNKRCVVSVRRSVYEALQHLAEIRARQIGLARRVPITYLIECMVRREFLSLAKSGLKFKNPLENPAQNP